VNKLDPVNLEADTKPLLERLRKALAHDLRSPLGTIGNYATILEYHDQAKPEEVRAFAGRIRTNLVRTVSMLSSMSEALALTIRKPSTKGAEPVTILRSLLAEFGVHPVIAEPHRRAEVDPDLLRYCWRAFLSIKAQDIQRELDPEILLHSDEDGFVTVDLRLAKDSELTERVDCAKYFLEHLDSPVHDACFAMSLAADLVTARGGSLELHGREGIPTGIRLHVPSAS
jgi:signal transduction histidine kinase